MIIKLVIQAVLFCLMLIGSNTVAGSSKDEQIQKPQIYVSVPPLAYLAEQIAGDNFEVVSVIGPGQSPATFETTPKQMVKISKAVVYFSAGVPFEKHLNKKLQSNFENLNIVDTQKGIELQEIEHHHHDHSHGKTEETNSLDPHSWLDPSLAKIMAQNIYDELTKIYPNDSMIYQNNLNLLFNNLDKIDSTIKIAIKPFQNQRFYTFHPAFGYFARAYGLNQIAIEVDGKEPSAKQLTNIIRKAKEDKIEILFTQPQFSDKSARAIAESVGAAVIPIDPLSRDYLSNLKEITRQLINAYRDNFNE